MRLGKHKLDINSIIYILCHKISGGNYFRCLLTKNQKCNCLGCIISANWNNHILKIKRKLNEIR